MSKIMEQLLNEEKIEAAKRMLERGKMTKFTYIICALSLNNAPVS